MKLWLLERVDGGGYDEAETMVIAAKSEERARIIADDNRGEEGMIWTDFSEVSCRELIPHEEKEGLIVRDLWEA